MGGLCDASPWKSLTPVPLEGVHGRLRAADVIGARCSTVRIAVVPEDTPGSLYVLDASGDPTWSCGSGAVDHPVKVTTHVWYL